MHSSRRIDNEPRTHRLDKQPRAHRLDLINCCAFSDCCGAPIIKGGICFECREYCEEEVGDRRPARNGGTPITGEDDLVVANGERPSLSFGAEDSFRALDEVALKIISE